MTAGPGGATAADLSTGAPTVSRDSSSTPGPASGSGSVGELLGEVTRDLSTLMRQEIELAKAEMKAEASKAGKGAGMLGGAGFAGYMLILFLSIALWWGLANVMDEAWAALIVAVLWGVVGAALFVLGKAQLKRVNPKPERTIDTLKDVPDAVKPGRRA
jgi:hypothetical protein